MGLLDAFFGAENQRNQPAGLLGLDPTTAGLLSAASAALMASGPSRVPISTGQVFGHMLQNGMLGYSDAEDARIRRGEHQEMADYRKAQIEQLKQKADSQKEIDALFKSRLYGAPGTMPAADMAASVDALGQGAAAGDTGPTMTNAARMNTIRPPQLQGQNSAFPFSLNDVTLLKTKGIDLTDVYKLATDPIKLEGGSTYVDRATRQERHMPKLGEGMSVGANGAVSVTPGYLDSLAAAKGAETRAVESNKANFDLLPPGYVGQDGRPIGGTRGAYINSFNQPAAPSFAPTPRPGSEGLDLNRLSPQQIAYLQRQDPEAFSNGATKFAATSQPSSSLQSSAVPGRAPVLQSEAEKQLQLGAISGRQGTQQDLNKNWITASYNPIVEAGRSANTVTASLDALQNIDLKTGWNTEAKAHAANVLAGLGVAPENAKLFAANAQKFQSVAMDRLLTTLQAQKGPQTEGDSTRAQQTFAQLKNTPEANQFISDFTRAKANADARRAQFYQEALPLAQQTGDLNEIDRRWANIQGSIWADPVMQRYVRSK